MYHPIEFSKAFTMDVEVSPKQRMERVKIRVGTRCSVFLMPRILETANGPVEAADLCFEDGCVARQIPFADFRFVD